MAKQVYCIQSWALNTFFLYLNTKYMLKIYLNTKYFLQMYLNTIKYFLNTFVNTILYIIIKISSLFIKSIINLKMNEIFDIKLVQLYSMSII